MSRAIFLNGIYEGVLTEIIEAQRSIPGLICYVQPYSQKYIIQFRKKRPSVEEPVEIYFSTTVNLGTIGYRGLIVGWEDKNQLSPETLAALNHHITRYQPDEKEIYLVGSEGRRHANLLAVSAVEKLSTPLHVGSLVKISNSTPVKERSRAGGWAYVARLPEWVGSENTIVSETVVLELGAGLRESAAGSDSARRKRLSKATRRPKRIQILSVGYRRNPDVIIEVLRRADGVCEICGRAASFIRASDGTPYLEVHHVETLASGGEDTPENSLALCPNCHRREHFGLPEARVSREKLNAIRLKPMRRPFVNRAG